jgi:hypothetical protein
MYLSTLNAGIITLTSGPIILRLYKTTQSLGIKSEVWIEASLNQSRGAKTILSGFVDNHAPHQLKLLFAIM